MHVRCVPNHSFSLLNVQISDVLVVYPRWDGATKTSLENKHLRKLDYCRSAVRVNKE